MVEQPALAWQAAAVASERAVGANNAMARHDDRNWIRSVGGAHGATCRGAADLVCDLSVAFRRAWFDRSKRSPYSTLERCAGSRGVNIVESVEVAFEVGVE